MKKITHYVLGIFVFLVGLWNFAYSSNQTDPKFSLKNLGGLDRQLEKQYEKQFTQFHPKSPELKPGDGTGHAKPG